MPGEELADALKAAERLKANRITTILTHLGENIADEVEAGRVASHYLEVLEQVRAHNLDSYVSVKLTQVGLDLGEEACLKNLMTIVKRAAALDVWVWIDMEQSSYVDRTLRVYRKAREHYTKVGVCLQAYLRRTARDVQELLPSSPAIRLVKGAYKEPAAIAYPKKSDVDKNYLALATVLLDNVIRNGVTLGIATHDKVLIRRIQHEAEQRGLSKNQYEFQLLYGIQSAEQARLADEGYRIRALISYGSYWFPWYVRRLAERPANVLFVLKNLFGA
jgi:proline dehydrogenase